MTKKLTVAKQWATFRRNAIPPNAPPIQVQEMQRAFYMGAYMTLMMLGNNVDENTSEEEGAQVLENIKQECEQFISGIGVLY